MYKEYLPAVEWLEMDYSVRDEKEGGWQTKPRHNPDGSYAHPERDLNTYRRGLYQILDTGNCGEYLRDICESSNGRECSHPDHNSRMECYCFPSRPGVILGLEWTEEDEERWLKIGTYLGVREREDEYLSSVHSYIYDFRNDDKPNVLIDWEGEGAA
jgi:hypothetical protein